MYQEKGKNKFKMLPRKAHIKKICWLIKQWLGWIIFLKDSFGSSCQQG